MATSLHALTASVGRSHQWFCQTSDGLLLERGPLPRAFLSGSFNPFHRGHQSLVTAAAERLGVPVAYELSIANVDKPPLDVTEVQRRLAQFRGLATVYVTRAMTFAEKSLLFPGSVMVIGADTAVRILSPAYYGNDTLRRDTSLEMIRAAGCRFLVGGRVDTLGQFVCVEGIDIPSPFRSLFEGFSEREFRIDLSSTQLRAPNR